MDDYSKINRKIKEIAGTQSAEIFTCEVKSVNGMECEVSAGDLLLSEVRLCAVSDENKNNLIITPKVGSQVMVADMSKGEKRDLAVVKYSEVESISINGGKLGGLIKIEELVKKINALIDAFNTHTHQVSTTGSASAQSGATTSMSSSVQEIKREDIEDKKIKH